MPRRKATRRVTNAREGVAPDSARPRAAAEPVARVLIVEGAEPARIALQDALRAKAIEVHAAPSLVKARAALADPQGPAFDCVLIDLALPLGGASALAREITGAPDRSGAAGPTKVILTSSSPSLDQAVEAIRVGAADLIAKPFDPEDLASRVLAVSRCARADRDRAAEVARLKRACKRLSAARQQVARQVDSLCNDLADAYQELADQMTNAALTNEFAALVRNELDVESLLRTCLEFILARTGPTNAAVFLPSNHADFALGAYVNYDCPKDSADVLLDHLADVLAPKIQDETSVVRLDTEAALARRLGDDAHWLADCDVLAFSCRHDGDCLAVGVLFRDRKNPFPPDAALQLKSISDIFGQQLARVVKIHHRHRPEEAWPGFERDSDDEGGLAA